MLIINTTFVVHLSIEAEVLQWLSSQFLPEAGRSGAFGTPTVARVLTRIEPDTQSIAVQLPATDATMATAWYNTTAGKLQAELHRERGERLMFFTTCMETIDPSDHID